MQQPELVSRCTVLEELNGLFVEEGALDLTRQSRSRTGDNDHLQGLREEVEQFDGVRILYVGL